MTKRAAAGIIWDVLFPGWRQSGWSRIRSVMRGKGVSSRAEAVGSPNDTRSGNRDTPRPLPLATAFICSRYAALCQWWSYTEREALWKTARVRDALPSSVDMFFLASLFIIPTCSLSCLLLLLASKRRPWLQRANPDWAWGFLVVLYYNYVKLLGMWLT